jgi:hypothetical protein
MLVVSEIRDIPYQLKFSDLMNFKKKLEKIKATIYVRNTRKII